MNFFQKLFQKKPPLSEKEKLELTLKKFIRIFNENVSEISRDAGSFEVKYFGDFYKVYLTEYKYDGYTDHISLVCNRKDISCVCTITSNIFYMEIKKEHGDIWIKAKAFVESIPESIRKAEEEAEQIRKKEREKENDGGIFAFLGR